MEITKESLEKQHYGLLKELFNYISKEDGVSDFDSWAEQNSIEKGNFLALGNAEDSTSTTKSFKSAKSQLSSKARSPERMEHELLHMEIPVSTPVPLDEMEVDEIAEPPASLQKRSDSGGKSANRQLEPQLSELESSAEHVMNDDEFGVMDQPDTAKIDEDESMKSIHNIEESNKPISKQDAISNELPRNYVKIYAAKMKKQGNPAKGYQILGSRLKIEAKPLTRVIPTANKSISTSDWKVAMDEVRLLNALDRVERLKEESLWPFKQLKPQINPPRPKAQWDYMLEEMEWMSEDFWQERKWKKTMACKFAHWCAEWHKTRDCGQFFEFGIFDGVLLNEIKEKIAPTKPEPVVKVETVKAEQIEDSIDPLLLAPSSSEATSELRKSPEEQAKVSNAIPASIKLKVPKIPPMILDMETDHYFQSATHAALANVPTVTPPEFITNAMYIESDSLVVCSQFMLADHYVETDKWDTIPEHPMKRLPGTQRYRSGPPKSSLFEPPPDYVSDENVVPEILLGPDGHEITPPKVPRLSFVKPTEAWTKDEEDALWQLAMTYGYNWPLIELCLNSSHVGNVRHRTLWCCYEKLRDLAAMKFTPHSKGDYIYAPYQSNKKDKKVKVLGLLSTFNFISGLSKKRDAAKPAATKSNKVINITAHETHAQIEQQIGIDKTQPPLRPAELSKIKEQRDLLAEQNRQQALLNAQNRASMPRPLMPQLGMQQQIRPGPARMGGPLNMNFRPPSFQQSPGQIAQRSPQVMAQGMMPQRNFNIDQLQSLMIAQQRYIANRSVHLDQSQTPNGQHVRPQILQRNQIQSDINTAAAFTALSNAQIAESKPQKVVEVPAADEEEGSDAENQPKRKKTSDSRSPTSKSNKKPANTKKPPPRKKTPTLSRQSKSNRRTSKPIVSETESEVEEDQLEDEESEEELEIDELESEAESDIDEIPEPPTKSRPPRTRPKRK